LRLPTAGVKDVTNLLILSNTIDSYPAIAFPFVLLLLVFAVLVFHGIITTPGTSTSFIDVIFTLVASGFLTLLVGGIGGIVLYKINDSSPALAWFSVVAFCLICVLVHRGGKKKKARERADNQRFHEAFMARHGNDLCRYCDAHKTGDGVIHHAPACSRR
jgi:hypothetical protein